MAIIDRKLYDVFVHPTDGDYNTLEDLGSLTGAPRVLVTGAFTLAADVTLDSDQTDMKIHFHDTSLDFNGNKFEIQSSCEDLHMSGNINSEYNIQGDYGYRWQGVRTHSTDLTIVNTMDIQGDDFVVPFSIGGTNCEYGSFIVPAFSLSMSWTTYGPNLIAIFADDSTVENAIVGGMALTGNNGGSDAYGFRLESDRTIVKNVYVKGCTLSGSGNIYGIRLGGTGCYIAGVVTGNDSNQNNGTTTSWSNQLTVY